MASLSCVSMMIPRVVSGIDLTKFREKNQPLFRKKTFWCIWCNCKNNPTNTIYSFLTVENLAYKKEAWINGKNPKKRHVSPKIDRGHPDKAVDGKIDFDLHACTILDNLYGDTPVWTVDLGAKTSVSGIIIYTWQESEGQMVKGQYRF